MKGSLSGFGMFGWLRQKSRPSKKGLLLTNSQVADVPTPAGPTPRQLGQEHLVRLEVGEAGKAGNETRVRYGATHTTNLNLSP
jgi:hypothetical protein